MRAVVPLAAMAALLVVPPAVAEAPDGFNGYLRIAVTVSPSLEAGGDRWAWDVSGAMFVDPMDDIAAVASGRVADDVACEGLSGLSQEGVYGGAGSDGGATPFDAGTCTFGPTSVLVRTVYWVRTGAAVRGQMTMKWGSMTVPHTLFLFCAADSLARPAPVTAYDMVCYATT